jgi:hypothetical protein
VTPLRTAAVVGALWIGLVLVPAVASWLEPDPVMSDGFAHAAWMFALSGGMCAAAGLFVALTVALINEVRGGAGAGSRPASGRALASSRSTGKTRAQ